MDGIEYLKIYCHEHKIDPDKILKLGRGSKGFNSSKKRYEFRPDTSTIKNTQLYAIQYFEDNEVYIAWEAARKRNPFSLKADEIILPMGDKVRSVKKDDQYSGWGEELVLYFQKEGIPDFMNRYVFNR